MYFFYPLIGKPDLGRGWQGQNNELAARVGVYHLKGLTDGTQVLLHTLPMLAGLRPWKKYQIKSKAGLTS